MTLGGMLAFAWMAALPSMMGMGVDEAVAFGRAVALAWLTHDGMGVAGAVVFGRTAALAWPNGVSSTA